MSDGPPMSIFSIMVLSLLDFERAFSRLAVYKNSFQDLIQIKEISSINEALNYSLREESN